MKEFVKPKFNVCDHVKLAGSVDVTGKITGSSSNQIEQTTKYLVKWYGGKKGRGHVWEVEEALEILPPVRARQLTGEYLAASLGRMTKERF